MLNIMYKVFNLWMFNDILSFKKLIYSKEIPIDILVYQLII